MMTISYYSDAAKWSRRISQPLAFKLLLLGIVLLLFNGTSMVAAAGDRNPYHTLGVSRESSQNDIQKRYKTLCLQYHPDKNVHRSTIERKNCEDKFKEIQHAYSQIGTEQGRRSFEIQERYGFGGSSSSTSSSTSSASPFDAADTFYRAFSNSSPSFYFSRGPDGRPHFGVRRSYSSAGPANFDIPGMSFKSIYMQEVEVPLEQLYTGTTMEFQLVDNIWTRWRAAIRGKSIYISLYQGLMYSLPVIRSSKIAAAIFGMVVVHATLPKPDPFNTYISKLPKGVKGNQTKVRFQQPRIGEPEVIFIIIEAPHPRYQRVGNDLHTRVTIRPREALRGCSKRIASLDQNNAARIVVDIPRNTSQGDTIRIRGEGWPLRNADLHGDLIVHVDIQKDEKKKRRVLRWLKRHFKPRS